MQLIVLVFAILIPWTLVKGGQETESNNQNTKHEEVVKLLSSILTQLDQTRPEDMTLEQKRRIAQIFQQLPDEYSKIRDQFNHEVKENLGDDNRVLSHLGIPKETTAPAIDKIEPKKHSKPNLKPALKQGSRFDKTDAAPQKKDKKGRRIVFADQVNMPLERERVFKKESAPSEYVEEGPVNNQQMSEWVGTPIVNKPNELLDQTSEKTLNGINSNQEEQENTYPAPAKTTFKLPDELGKLPLPPTEKSRLEQANEQLVKPWHINRKPIKEKKPKRKVIRKKQMWREPTDDEVKRLRWVNFALNNHLKTLVDVEEEQDEEEGDTEKQE